MELITKKQAIEAIDEIEAEIADGFGFEYEKWRKYFCDLPPAQSDVPDINVGDTISRQAAIDLLKQMRKDGDMIPWEGKDVFARIRKLPPAQPERIRGRWIAKEKKNLFRCSKCDAVIYSESKYDRNEFHKFCGRCGAEMENEVTE